MDLPEWSSRYLGNGLLDGLSEHRRRSKYVGVRRVPVSLQVVQSRQLVVVLTAFSALEHWQDLAALSLFRRLGAYYSDTAAYPYSCIHYHPIFIIIKTLCFALPPYDYVRPTLIAAKAQSIKPALVSMIFWLNSVRVG